MTKARIGKAAPKAKLPEEKPPATVPQEADTNRIFRGLCLQMLKDPASTPSERIRAMEMYDRLVDRASPGGSGDFITQYVNEASVDMLDQELDSVVVRPVMEACLGKDVPWVNVSNFPETRAFLTGEFERRVEEVARARARWLLEREVGPGEPDADEPPSCADKLVDEDQPESVPRQSRAVPSPPGIDPWPKHRRRRKRQIGG